MSSTQRERILRKLNQGGWHPGPSFGQDYRELSARLSELKRQGIFVKSRRQNGKRTYEYKMESIV